MLFHQPSWISYFISGLLVITASWLTSGCNGISLGNKVQPAATKPPDAYSGFYNTELKNLKVCSSHPDEVCQPVTGSPPSMVTNVLTNPTYFYLANRDTGEGALYPYHLTGNDALPILLNFSDMTLSKTIYLDDTEPLWETENCTISYPFTQKGSLSRFDGPIPTDHGRDAVGTLKLVVGFERKIEGDCAYDLEKMYTCYQDVTKCGTNDESANQKLQAWVKGLVDNYISAKTMTVEDIKTLRSVRWEATYE